MPCTRIVLGYGFRNSPRGSVVVRARTRARAHICARTREVLPPRGVLVMSTFSGTKKIPGSSPLWSGGGRFSVLSAEIRKTRNAHLRKCLHAGKFAMRSCGELSPNGDGYAVALRAENQPSSSHCFSQLALSFECLIRIGSSIVNTQKSDARQPWGHNAPIPPRRRRMRSIPQGIFFGRSQKTHSNGRKDICVNAHILFLGLKNWPSHLNWNGQKLLLFAPRSVFSP